MLSFDYISFDLETTGTDTEKDRIVSIGIVRFEGDKPDEDTGLRWICNPGVTMSPENIAIHGITNEEAASYPPFSDIAHTIHHMISSSQVITGFNLLRFDVPFLYAEFARRGIDWEWRRHRFIDSYQLYQKRERRDLAAAMRFYFGEERTDAHDSLSDATAAGRLIAEQIKTYNLGGLSPEELAKETAGDQEYLDISRKIKSHQGKAVFAFGKWKDEPVSEHKEYAEWMLTKGDFSADTKRVLIDLLTTI